MKQAISMRGKERFQSIDIMKIDIKKNNTC